MNKLIAMIFCMLTLISCSDASNELVSSKTEAADGTGGDQTDPNAPVPVIDSMLVTMGIRFRAPAGGGPITTYPLTADVTHNYTDVTFIAVNKAPVGVVNSGTFFTTTNPGHAKIVIQPTEFSALTTLLNTPGREVSVVFSYDNNKKWLGQDKPILGQTFSLRGSQPIQLIMHVAPGTRVPAGTTSMRLYYSIWQPTYDFLNVLVTNNGTVNEGIDWFNSPSKTATFSMSSSNWTAMTTAVNKVGFNTQVMIWYENNPIDQPNKELLGLPVFTNIAQ